MIANPAVGSIGRWVGRPTAPECSFSSDRGGSTGLWATAMQSDGLPQGLPELVKPDIGGHRHSACRRRAGLCCRPCRSRKGAASTSAEVDFDDRHGVTKPPTAARQSLHRDARVRRTGRATESSCPFVYARNWSGRTPTIAIRSLETGRRPRDPDGRSRNGRNPAVVTRWQNLRHAVASIMKDKRGIYEIDAQTGAAHADSFRVPRVNSSRIPGAIHQTAQASLLYRSRRAPRLGTRSSRYDRSSPVRLREVTRRGWRSR